MSQPFELPGCIVDAWINPNLGPPKDSSLNVDHLFPELRQRLERGTDLSQLIDEMDAAGVTHGVLCCGGSPDYDELNWVRAAIEKYPDRFVGSHIVDPRSGMGAVRLVDSLVRNDGFRLIRMRACDTQLGYDQAEYYPVYAKCAELGVPVGLNVGLPGPKVPGRHQHPIALDSVCCHFPELTVLMQHGGDPWVDVCVALMRRWDNLYYMTSAFTPRRIPAPIIQFLNTRGRHKIMFGSDYPVLTFERCVREARELPLRDQGAFDALMGENAHRIFFSAN